MPEYLSPGVYIEETSYRAKSIQGVATSTAGFVGLCATGPTQGPPPLITSFEEYRRTFGDVVDLVLSGQPTTNYMAHAVKAFFDNGGQRVYIARVVGVGPGLTPADYAAHSVVFQMGGGQATTWSMSTPAGVNDFTNNGTPINPAFFARYAGNAGNLPLSVSALRGGNLLSNGSVVGARLGDVVQVVPQGQKILSRNVALAVASVDATGTTLTIPNHGLAANQIIAFASPSGTLPGTLTGDTAYYVANPTPSTVQLSNNPVVPIQITNPGSGTITVTASPRAITQTITLVDTVGMALTVANHKLLAGQTVTVTGTGLSSTGPYYVWAPTTNTFQLASALAGPAIPIPGGGTGPVTVTSTGALGATVDPSGTNTITIPSPGLIANQTVSIASTGTFPPAGGLAPNTPYLVTGVVSTTTTTKFTLKTLAGVAIAITAAPIGNVTVIPAVTMTVTAVDPVGYALTIPNHGLVANQVILSIATTGTYPAGLGPATATYYVVNPTPNTFQLLAAAVPLVAVGAYTGTLTALTLVSSQLYSVSFDSNGNALLTGSATPTPPPLTATALASAVAVQRVTLSVSVGARGGQIDGYSGMSTHPTSPSYLGTVLRSDNPADSQARIYFGFHPAGIDNTLTLDPSQFALLFVALAAQAWPLALTNGGDGLIPTDSDLFVGTGADVTATGLTALADVDDIAIVAAPDCSTFDDPDLQQSIRDALIIHCETLKYRFAILSAGELLDENQVQSVRSQMDSSTPPSTTPGSPSRIPSARPAR